MSKATPIASTHANNGKGTERNEMFRSNLTLVSGNWTLLWANVIAMGRYQKQRCMWKVAFISCLAKTFCLCVEIVLCYFQIWNLHRYKLYNGRFAAVLVLSVSIPPFVMYCEKNCIKQCSDSSPVHSRGSNRAVGWRNQMQIDPFPRPIFCNLHALTTNSAASPPSSRSCHAGNCAVNTMNNFSNSVVMDEMISNPICVSANFSNSRPPIDKSSFHVSL